MKSNRMKTIANLLAVVGGGFAGNAIAPILALRFKLQLQISN